MRFSKRNIVRAAVLLIVFVLGASLLACNRQDYVTPELPDGYEVNPTGKIKASFYLRSGTESEIAIDKWIKVYNEQYPNVKVKKDIIEWSQFTVQIAAGDIGDVFFTGNVTCAEVVTKYKAAMPLDAYVENLNIDVQQVYTSIYDGGIYNGLLYVVPSDITRSVFLVNVSALREAGLDKPKNDWTWDDLVNTYCPALHKVNPDGSLAQVGIFVECYGEALPLEFFFEGWGGKLVDTVNKKTHFYSDEKVVEGITQIIDLIRKGYATTTGLRGEIGAIHANLRDPQDYGFKFAHHGGMLWQDRIKDKLSYNELGLEMDVVCPPLTPVRYIPGGGFGYFVYSKTRNPDAAATFALTLLTYDGQVAFNSIVGGGIPTRKDVGLTDVWRLPFDQSEYNYDAYAVYPESVGGGGWRGTLPPELVEIVERYVHTFVVDHLNNVRDYKDTLSKIETLCNEKWAELYTEG